MDASAFRGVGDAIAAVFVVAVVASVGGAALLIYVVWSWATEPDWQHEAISRGFALYCPGDGEFAWIGECSEGAGQ